LRVLASHLEQLDAESSLDARQCPACANRDNGVAKNARYLLDEIAENAEFQERFGTSPALCVPHFRLVWNEAGSDERTLLRDTQLDAVRALRIDILEHLRKQRAEFAHEQVPVGLTGGDVMHRGRRARLASDFEALPYFPPTSGA
jgi:hypothetical protein